MDFSVALTEAVIAVAVFAFLYWFLGRFFRGRPPEESDEGGPYAGVTAPLRPRTPRRAAKAAVEEPDEPDVQD